MGGGSISVADIATQEQLLREAMNRKKKKQNSQQQQQQNEKTVHAGDGVLGNTNDNARADEDKDSNSEKRRQQSDVNNSNNNQINAASVAARMATVLGVHATATMAARSGQMGQKSVA